MIDRRMVLATGLAAAEDDYDGDQDDDDDEDTVRAEPEAP